MWVVAPEVEIPVGLSGKATQWRVRVRDGDGNWSDWSDWAAWSYIPLPTLTMDSPSAAGVLTDPTPTIIAHINARNLATWRIRVTAGTDRTKIRYDSLRQTSGPNAKTLTHTIPERNSDGKRVFVDDTNYQINVRAWDEYDREGTVSNPAFAEAWTTVHFDDDAAIPAPTALTATQVGIGPHVHLFWTCPVAPDAWVVYRSGKFIGRLDPASVTAGGGGYAWTDGGYSEPFVPHTWKVKAVVGGKMSLPSNIVTLTTKPHGLWLITASGDVVLRGTSGTDPGIDDFKYNDRRATFKPINLPYDVDIITGQEGLSGNFTGSLQVEADQDIDTALAVLEAIKDAPRSAVRMVFAQKSIPVKIRHMSVVPRGDFTDRTRTHKVEFGFWQVGNFEGEAD